MQLFKHTLEHNSSTHVLFPHQSKSEPEGQTALDSSVLFVSRVTNNNKYIYSDIIL